MGYHVILCTFREVCGNSLLSGMNYTHGICKAVLK